MKRNKVAKLMAVVALVGAVGVGGSLALLTAQSDVVTNTFVVGKGLVDADITLDEAKMKNTTTSEEGKNVVDRTTKQTGEYEYEKEDGNNRVKQNEYINLQSGDDVYKDPTVHVAENTADCYLFIKVSGVDELKKKGIEIDTKKNGLGTTWVKVDDYKENADGIYGLKKENNNNLKIVETAKMQQDFVVFESLDIKDSIFNNQGSSNLNDTSIKVQALAVQATNVAENKAIDTAKKFGWDE